MATFHPIATSHSYPLKIRPLLFLYISFPFCVFFPFLYSLITRKPTDQPTIFTHGFRLCFLCHCLCCHLYPKASFSALLHSGLSSNALCAYALFGYTTEMLFQNLRVDLKCFVSILFQRIMGNKMLHAVPRGTDWEQQRLIFLVGGS